MTIHRSPDEFARKRYDVAVVGGGIYGGMVALEAVFRGLKPLLLERDDFGAATSFNNLRTIHGGLRYLQSADLRRHRQSVRERRWFLASFPDFVRPIACMMPLYGRGLKRPSILRLALAANDVLSLRRNAGLPDERHIPAGRVLSAAQTKERFLRVNERNLQGAALWYDGAVPDSQRLIIELMRWAAEYGADILNYTEVLALESKNGRVAGVRAVDRNAGTEYTFDAPVVVNAAGPWAPRLAGRLLGSRQDWSWPSLAWNVLIDRPALSGAALAVTPPGPGAATYFAHPWKGRILVGTGHAEWTGSIDEPVPSARQLGAMLDGINAAVPGLDIGFGDVERVFAGLLPAAAPGSPEIARHPVVVDHARRDGMAGLFSVAGVKFTTARLVAATTLDRIFGGSRNTPRRELPRPAARRQWTRDRLGGTAGGSQWTGGIERLVRNESATNLRDIVFRRTDFWEDPEYANEVAPRISDIFAWPEGRIEEELALLARELDSNWSPDP
ncbi:MAG: FAD-dependent oxidoreductase [Proteobacteria bacterium]|nr:FAD-dependent oxidoreductase [Pseudomonadota bacterium]